jgi:predicted PurR-regulated permease PerM
MEEGRRRRSGVAGEGGGTGRGRPSREERLASRLGNRLYRFALLLFLLALLYRYFDSISYVLLIAFVGAILGIAFNSVIVRVPIRRGVATILLALVILGTIGFGGYVGISAVVAQLRQLASDIPGILATLERWEADLQEATGLDIELLGPQTEQLFGQLTGGFDGGRVLTGTLGLLELVALAALVLVGALFVVARPNQQLLNPLIRSVPRGRRPAFRRMFHLLGERLSGWLFGTLMSMIIIGGLSATVFYFLGVPYPLLLGLLIGIIDIIPLVGPWIGGAIAVVVTLFHDPGLALWVAVSVLIIQEVEGNLIRPLVMSSSAELHPFVTLLSLLLFSAMFGLLGAILALPLALAIATIVQVLWVEETLEAGDDEIDPLVET